MRPFGAKTSRYGPNVLGYRRATKTLQSDAILFPSFCIYFLNLFLGIILFLKLKNGLRKFIIQLNLIYLYI